MATASESATRRVAGAVEADFQASTAYTTWVLVLLFGVAVLNMLDRQILGMLVVPIKAEFGVSDTAMGFLTGPSFALFYALAGIPIARWADRGVRRSIISIGLLPRKGRSASAGATCQFPTYRWCPKGI